MRVEHLLSDEWEVLNLKVAEYLSLDRRKAQARVFHGVGQALMDMVLGLARANPLKKKVLYFKNMDPFHEPVVKELARQGHPILTLPTSAIKDPGVWAGELDKDLLLALYSKDDPLLGSYFVTDKAQALLREKRVFQVRVSHFQHLSQRETLAAQAEPHGIDIFSLAPDLAVAISGDRVRVSGLVASQMHWPNEILSRVSDGWTTQLRDRAEIESFEAAGHGGARPFFEPGALRILDRAVVYWEDMDGYAFIHALAGLSGEALAETGFPNRLEATSPSRCRGLRTNDWMFEALAAQPNQIRGLVIIGAEALTAELPTLMDQARRLVLAQQTGELN